MVATWQATSCSVVCLQVLSLGFCLAVFFCHFQFSEHLGPRWFIFLLSMDILLTGRSSKSSFSLGGEVKKGFLK